MLPYLVIQPPNGPEQRHELRHQRYTLGRAPENDIPLDETCNPPSISRLHCELKRDAGVWWLVDLNSTNGTQLEREGRMQAVEALPDRCVPLAHNDVILLHGWRLTFQDLNGTHRLTPRPAPVTVADGWVYRISQATLYQVRGGVRSPVEGLRPQANRLLEVMARKNQAQRGEPVLCRYDELLAGIWPNEVETNASPGNDQVQKLVLEIRNLFEQYGEIDREAWLKTKRGQGYLLRITIEP